MLLKKKKVSFFTHTFGNAANINSLLMFPSLLESGKTISLCFDS